uniref:Uncharacterized protein n=1 Tax=Strongyloides venezuelensis TaxID=75913 RepID=A0A0K0EVW2_STRVS
MEMDENNKISKILLPKGKDVIINEITKKISELCNDTQNIENNLYFVKEEEKEKGDVIGDAIRDVFLEYHKYFIHLMRRENNFCDSNVIDKEFISRMLCDSIFCDLNINIDNIVERYNSTIDKKIGNSLQLVSSLSSLQSISPTSSSYHTTSSNTDTPINNLKLNDLASKVADEILRKMPSQESSNELLKALMMEVGNLCKQGNVVNSNQQIDAGVQTFQPTPISYDILKLNENDNMSKKELKNVGLQTSVITTPEDKLSVNSQDTLSSSYIPSNILSSEISSSISINHSPGQVNLKNFHYNHDFIVYEVDIDGSIVNVNKNDVYNLDDISKIKRYSPNNYHESLKKNDTPTPFNIDRERCILKIEEIKLDSIDNENIIDYSNITPRDEINVCSKNKNVKTFLNNGSTTTTLSSISTIPNSI